MRGPLRLIAVFIGIVAVAGSVWLARHRLAGLVRSSGGNDGASMTPAAPGPATAPAAGQTPRADVAVDLRKQQFIGVKTVKAARASMSGELRAVGTVQYDETRLRDVNVKLDGWIRDLRVDYTGQPVEIDQPLFTLYSPELLAAETEYVLALRGREQVQASQLADARARADQLVAAARRRLTLWDLGDDDLRQLETTGEARDTMVVRSPFGGLVMEKAIVQGQHVGPGQTLYRLADVAVVWIEAEVYENELAAVHPGDRAAVTLDAYPAERFAGRVVYIYPSVNPQTRTTKVRVELANPRGRLKPGMFANVVMSVEAGDGIVVPVDAVLDSGREQLVFVAQGEGHFEPRQVTTGRRLGDRIQIASGLSEGEDVATGATFFLDADSQMRASAGQYAAAPVTPAAAAVPQVRITLATTPNPLVTGENQFQVTVKDAAGAAIDGAEVSVQLYMAAMPTMGMPALRNDIALSGAGAGVYRGTGQVMTAGRWDATVTVRRAGQRLGTVQQTLVAR